MIQRGPFVFEWNPTTGQVVVEDVEQADVTHEIDSEEFNTLGGRRIEVDGNYKAGAALTLLATKVTDLAPILPQHFVAMGETMSTGEVVEDADGAMDFAAQACTTDPVYGDLDIVSCGNPGQVSRLVNARTKFEGIEYSDKLAKVTVRWIGEPASDEATMQFFAEGGLATS